MYFMQQAVLYLKGSEYEPVLTQGVSVNGNLGQFGISLHVNSVLLVSSRQVSALQKPP